MNGGCSAYSGGSGLLAKWFSGQPAIYFSFMCYKYPICRPQPAQICLLLPTSATSSALDHATAQRSNQFFNFFLSLSLSLLLFFFLFQGEFRRLSVVSIRLNRINLNCFVFFLFVFFFGSKWLHLHLVRLNEAKGEIDGNFRLIFNLISF